MHLLSVIFLIWLNVSIQANVDFSNISVYFGRNRYKWEYVIVTKINRIYTCELTPGYLNLSIDGILGLVTLCCGALSCALYDVSSIPGLYTLDAKSISLPKLWWSKMSPNIAKCALGAKVTPHLPQKSRCVTQTHKTWKQLLMKCLTIFFQDLEKHLNAWNMHHRQHLWCMRYAPQTTISSTCKEIDASSPFFTLLNSLCKFGFHIRSKWASCQLNKDKKARHVHIQKTKKQLEAPSNYLWFIFEPMVFLF